MMKYTPVFKMTEVLVRIKGNDIQLSSERLVSEVVGEVVFAGERCEYYKVGDLVLVNEKLGSESKIFGESLFKFAQERIITCALKAK